MEHDHEILTPRLRLRAWRATDEAAMQAINTDPEVTRYLNRPMDTDAVDGFISGVVEHWAVHGFGCFALESRENGFDGRLLGFAGVGYPTFLPEELSQRPELGWRLARHAWGRGLATEAAGVARDDAFSRLGLLELISIIHPENERSRRVATKLGLNIEREVFNPVLNRRVEVWQAAGTQERHGEGWESARDAIGSPGGWPGSLRLLAEGTQAP